MRHLTALPALALLAACGGTIGTGITPSGDAPATDPSFVVGTSIAALSFSGFQGDGTLRDGTDESMVNLATGVVTGGLFAGRLNGTRTRIDLDGGGTVEIDNPGETEYVRLFRAEPATGDPVFGVLGFQSLPGDLPGTGRISYTGAARVQAADAFRLYTLDGTAFVVADFGARTVQIELRELGGTAEGVSPGNTGTVAVPGGGRITVEGSAISGAGFSGGRATATGLPFGITGSADATGTTGGFFGPGADEVAGRVVVTEGDVEVFGSFAAD